RSSSLLSPPPATCPLSPCTTLFRSQLCAGGGRRRAARRLRVAVHRRRPGVHPVLPAVLHAADAGRLDGEPGAVRGGLGGADLRADRKSTRLNSSHVKISYAVFCSKK